MLCWLFVVSWVPDQRCEALKALLPAPVASLPARLRSLRVHSLESPPPAMSDALFLRLEDPRPGPFPSRKHPIPPGISPLSLWSTSSRLVLDFTDVLAVLIYSYLIVLLYAP